MQRRHFISSIGSTLLVNGLAACGGGSGGGAAVSPTAPPIAPQPVYRLSGLAFGPYIDGQNPNIDPRIGEEQVRARLQTIAPFTRSVRTYGCANGLERIPAQAAAMNLRVTGGAWIGRDLDSNERELSNLIALGASGTADTLVVGSEVLLRSDVTEAKLLQYIDRVRRGAPNVAVAYADTYDQLLAHPGVIASVDVVLAHFHPYWEGIAIEDAVAAIHASFQRVIIASPGKQVIVGETGWPTAGNRVGLAEPSPENAAAFLLQFVSWARATGAEYYYFEAFDELWKALYEGPQGAHWGLWDSVAVMKSGVLQPVLNGLSSADTWSRSLSVPGGPGAPTLEFISVPRIGSTADLVGRALHVSPADHRVVVYILVANRWWVKPTAAALLTSITPRTGNWVTDITTGGNDTSATHVAAFLVPAGYSPPVLLGAASLPAELSSLALASLQIARSS